jgi:hypothetical protein
MARRGLLGCGGAYNGKRRLPRCGGAYQGAAWPFRVHPGQLGCGVTKLLLCRSDVRHIRVFSLIQNRVQTINVAFLKVFRNTIDVLKGCPTRL